MTGPRCPSIRLKPKVRPQLIRNGFPWVYDNELVTDRRTKSLKPGSLAVLEDALRNPIALVAVNPHSRIMARVLGRDLDAEIDQEWFEHRIGRALRLREKLFDAPFYRLVHAEADGLPGVVIDRFGETAVIQPNAAWADARLSDLTAALVARTGVQNVYMNASGRARALEGLGDQGCVLQGEVSRTPIEVPMNGAVYMADLLGGQKTGLFFDQRMNHRMASALAQDASVLDVFSHVGGFALAALAGGAKSALAVDGSEAALELAERGATRMGQSARLMTRRGDAFDILEALKEEGAQFDLVICDPPAFAPSKKAMNAGLRAYERIARLAASLVVSEGFLVLCSCSHAVSPDAFRKACSSGLGRAGREAALIHSGGAALDHPLHPRLAESSYLKALFFRL